MRQILGYLRYDCPPALKAINDLYRNELRWMMNLYQPSVKLIKKLRPGARTKRLYDEPKTPLDRLLACQQPDPIKLQELIKLRDTLDPFKLSQIIEQKLDRLYKLANLRQSPRLSAPHTPKDNLSPIEEQALRTISKSFAIPVYVSKKSLSKS